MLELIKTEFARRFENEDTATCGLGEVANIWNKTVKPMNIPGTLWEHYSIPAFDAEQYPSYELGDTIKSNKYEVVSNSILVSKLNPSTRRLWIPQLIDEKSAICSTEFMEYVPNNPKEYSFYCSALLQDRFFSYLAGHVTGSTGSRQRVHPSDTLAYEVPNPDASEILNYCNYADPLIKQLRNSSIERQKLTQLRAVLLPKLMSGEIDASKVELPTPPTQTAPTNGRLWLVRVLFSCCSALCIWTSRTSVEPKGSTMVGNHTVESILKAMQNTLNAHQLKRLKGVLSANLAVETNTVEDNENKNLLNSFLTAKELEGCSERTLKYYESTLAHYIRETSAPLTQVDTEQLRAYLTDYQDTHVVGKVTIDNIRRILATFFSWLEDEDYIVKSPARKIRRVKAPVRVKEIISDEDMERLRDGCETIRDLAMIDLLSSTGMRVGELVKLNRTSINMGERECIVQGKGNKERKAYFDARAKLHLEEYLRERNDDNPALFVGLCGNHARISICSVENRLRSLGKKLQLPRVHPHKFRRTMATNAINRGMPVEQVQKLLGHVKIETTMEYALVSQSNVKASHRRYLG